MMSGCRATTELLSLVALLIIRQFGDFFPARITVEYFFLFESEEDDLPWFALTVEYDEVVGTVGLID